MSQLTHRQSGQAEADIPGVEADIPAGILGEAGIPDILGDSNHLVGMLAGVPTHQT
jgi:hypothetical protein